MYKEWWCAQYEEICFELFGKEYWELSTAERKELDAKANDMIRDRFADLCDAAHERAKYEGLR